MPDDGQLVVVIQLIADTAEKQQKLLEDNPQRTGLTVAQGLGGTLVFICRDLSKEELLSLPV